MEHETQSSQTNKINVNVPKKQFSKWLREDSRTARLKIWCDLAKESFPYVSVVVVVGLTCFVYREALIVVVPSILTWLIHLRKAGGQR
jgi:hypothetical protein